MTNRQQLLPADLLLPRHVQRRRHRVRQQRQRRRVAVERKNFAVGGVLYLDVRQPHTMLI